MKQFFLTPLAKGAIVVLPLVITAWLLWSTFAWLDGIGMTVLSFFQLQDFLFPGAGLLITLITLLTVGLLFQFNPISWIYDYLEDALMRIPLVKTLYGAVRDFAAMFDSDKPKAQQVVLVDMPNLGQIVGFITSHEVPECVLNTQTEQSQLVSVYLPMSYMVGGYTLFLPKERLTTVDWSVEDAMRYALTAGISQSHARLKHTDIEQKDTEQKKQDDRGKPAAEADEIVAS
ncbi:MAG: DUF502 domain-containing protein [Oleibacter sp.]|nr:DUF502 domain-containing protein [Thalassolituus sp.]